MPETADSVTTSSQPRELPIPEQVVAAEVAVGSVALTVARAL